MSKRLLQLKNSIENMTKYHQIEILRKLSNHKDVCINENNNGTFINLTEQTENIINILETYSVYVKEQQEQLNEQETEKNIIKQTYF
jgi:hypothetical protein